MVSVTDVTKAAGTERADGDVGGMQTSTSWVVPISITGVQVCWVVPGVAGTVQFKMVSMCEGKPTRAPPHLREGYILYSVAFEVVSVLVWLVKAHLRKMFEHLLFLCPSLLQVIDGVMHLALCLQLVPQAPQHFNSLKLQALAMDALQKGQMTDGGVWCVQVHWLVPVQVPVTDATRGAGTERTDGHPQESNRGGTGICLSFFNECRNLNPVNKTSLGLLVLGFTPKV